jgi:hypothetical protein
MKHYKDTKFLYYPSDIRIPNPLGTVTLEKFLKANKEPKGEIVSLFKEIEKASEAGDMELKSNLKEKLFYFTPCVTTDGKGRSYSNITSFTSLLVLDFDKIERAEEFKQFLFNAVPSIIAAYLSPSKKGCKFIVRIPVCKTTDEFKSYFYGMAYYLEKYEGFDPSTQNCILPLYLSIDPKLLYRDDAEVWTKRGEKLDEFKAHVGEIEVLENVTEKEVEKVKRIISISMGKIVDSGHYIVRSSSLSLGGYVASGYLSQEDAEELMNGLIEENTYLKKNISGYKKTAKDMIAKGMRSPLYLKDE